MSHEGVSHQSWLSCSFWESWLRLPPQAFHQGQWSLRGELEFRTRLLSDYITVKVIHFIQSHLSLLSDYMLIIKSSHPLLVTFYFFLHSKAEFSYVLLDSLCRCSWVMLLMTAASGKNEVSWQTDSLSQTTGKTPMPETVWVQCFL